MNKKNTQKILKLLLPFVSMLMVLIVLEAALGILKIKGDVFGQVDAYLGTSGIPNKTGRFISKEYNVEVRLNSLGFRDDEYLFEKPDNTFRIVVLGDSFTQAKHVSLENTFHYILEQRLKKYYKKKNIEVISLGISAHGTAQEYLVLKRYGLLYNPDLVILAFYFNDLLENNLNMMGKRDRPYFVLENGNLKEVPFSIPFYKKIFANYIVRIFPRSTFFILDKIEMLKRSQSKLPEYVMFFKRHSSKEMGNSWNITKKLILKIKEETESVNAEFLLLCLTDGLQLYPSWWKEMKDTFPEMKRHQWDLTAPNKILKRFSKKNRIRLLQFLPRFKKNAGNTPPLHFRYDGHWNNSGHKLAAEILFDYLIKTKLIEGLGR